MSVNRAATEPQTTPPIPQLIRRNTMYLAASQALVGAGNQMVPTLGAIIVVKLLGNASFAGVGTSILGASRFLVAYPLGKVVDTYGRRVGIAAGLLIGVVGAVVTGLSVIFLSFPLFLLGMLVFGAGLSAAQQLRVAAADMYPPRLRGRGLGLVLTGSLAGALGGPLIIKSAQSLSLSVGVDATALAWILVPIFIFPGLFLILQVRPDPKAIAANLAQYYPGEKLPPPAARTDGKPSGGFFTYVRHYPKLSAFTSMFAVQGTMSMLMAMTPLVLSRHGHGLGIISLAVTMHVIGMFGFSLPLGRLSDRFGRRPVLLAGLLIGVAGGIIMPMTPSYFVITFGIFLVGLGWSCVNVASTALIADTTDACERGRAIGANDTFSAASGVTLPLVGGVVAEYIGLP
ncbi:MAG: MFS transporter, partial [SAR202 cluster bacterium]|nr:MFS transporter [SAR202 cluster bacterium]